MGGGAVDNSLGLCREHVPLPGRRRHVQHRLGNQIIVAFELNQEN